MISCLESQLFRLQDNKILIQLIIMLDMSWLIELQLQHMLCLRLQVINWFLIKSSHLVMNIQYHG